MEEFLNFFQPKDYIMNDHRVGKQLERLITNETDVKTLGMDLKQQSNFWNVDWDV